MVVAVVVAAVARRGNQPAAETTVVVVVAAFARRGNQSAAETAIAESETSTEESVVVAVG